MCLQLKSWMTSWISIDAILNYFDWTTHFKTISKELFIFFKGLSITVSTISSLVQSWIARVDIALSLLILSWILVGPGLEFPHLEKTGRVPVSTRSVFLVQKKLIGALSGSSEEFLVSLKYGKSICICRGPD